MFFAIAGGIGVALLIFVVEMWAAYDRGSLDPPVKFRSARVAIGLAVERIDLCYER